MLPFYKYHKHYFQILGHLNGKLDRHFTPEACPVYHNTTKKWCQTFKNEVNKKNNTRKKALTLSATKSPLGSPSNEQNVMQIRFVYIYSIFKISKFLRFQMLFI